MLKAIALFSGGLDSILAVQVIRRQQIEVLGLTFETPFFTAEKAKKAASVIKLPLLVENITTDHLVMLKSPRYGYGRNMNPCLDCHILMLKTAGGKMQEIGAEFILTGEVIGQRPMSQGKQSLFVVAKNSGYSDYILRPLSAQLLKPIKPEREGKIDRSKLLAIQGRGRKQQIQLAAEFGITSYAAPAGGCLLTDPMFTRRLRDLFSHQEDRQIRDIELLKFGRHFRIRKGRKIIVGRNRSDNESLIKLSAKDDSVLFMADYPGPCVIIPYGGGEAELAAAASLCVLYSDAPGDMEAKVNCRQGDKHFVMKSVAAAKADYEHLLI